MKVVVYFHGWNSSKDSLPIVPLCEDYGYQYFNFDFYLHGANGLVNYDKPITFNDLIMQAREVLKQFINDEVILIGHSMGGAIALIVASEFKNINKLILIDPLYPTAEPNYNGGILQTISNLDINLKELSKQKISEDLKSLKAKADRYSLINKRDLVLLAQSFSKKEFQDYFKDVKRNDSCQWYLIMGSKDAIFDASKTINWFKEFNPTTKIYEIEGASHSPYRSHPEVFDIIMKQIFND